MSGKSAGENLSSTNHSGYGQFSQSRPWRARSLCLQRPFRMHLLPSPVLLQPVQRLRRFHASARQRSQCGWLEGAAGTDRGSLREEEIPQILSWGCRLFQAGIYEYLEEEGFLYAIRLPANDVLQEEIEHLLTRTVGRPPRKPIVWFADFKYQASSWDRPRRVIAKVEWHQGELYPRVGFM